MEGGRGGRHRFLCEVCCAEAQVEVVELTELKVIGLRVWCEAHKFASVGMEFGEKGGKGG